MSFFQVPCHLPISCTAIILRMRRRRTEPEASRRGRDRRRYFPTYALKKDGSTVAAEPDTGSYSNVGADGGPAVWSTFNTWKFQEPVNLEEVTALSLAGETLPVS